MSNVSLTTFSDSLAQLRQALADADLLAASPQTALFSTTAETVAAAFAAAPDEARLRFLLRALDDAIAASEVAARLADELHGPAERGPALDGEAGALQEAYRAFAESQTTYQALYLYRNVLARQVGLEARPIPEAVTAAKLDSEGVAAPQEPGASAGTTRKRTHKRSTGSGRDA
jgi:hypothetical protein